MSHYVAFPDEDVYHAWTKAGAGGQPAILTMCGKHGRKTTREEQTYDDGSPRPEIHYGQPPEERTPCEACRRELVPYFENGFSPGSGAAQSCAQALTVGELIQRLAVADVPYEAKVEISVDSKGQKPFTGETVAFGSSTHHPASDLSFPMADRRPGLDEDGNLQFEDPEHRFKSVTIHCHEDVRTQDEVPDWFPHVWPSEYTVLDDE